MTKGYDQLQRERDVLDKSLARVQYERDYLSEKNIEANLRISDLENEVERYRTVEAWLLMSGSMLISWSKNREEVEDEAGSFPNSRVEPGEVILDTETGKLYVECRPLLNQT